MRVLIAVTAMVASGFAAAGGSWWERAAACDAFFIWIDRPTEAKAIRAEAQRKASLLGSAAEGYEAGVSYEMERIFWHRILRATKDDGHDAQTQAKGEIVDRNCFQYVPD